MANFSVTDYQSLVSAVNSSNQSAADDVIYLQNDIEVPSGQSPELFVPQGSGNLSFRGGVIGGPPVDYKLTLIESRNVGDSTPATEQPSVTFGPLTVQTGAGGWPGGFSGTYGLNGGTLAFNRSVEGDYVTTVTLSGSNTIRNDGIGVVRISGSASPSSTAVRSSQTDAGSPPESYSLTLGGAGRGEISGSIRDGGTPTSLGAVTKAGPGTWTLASANTYGGGTVISGGNLILTRVTSLNEDGSINSAAAGKGAISFAPLSGSATARLTLGQNAQATLQNTDFNRNPFPNTIQNFGVGNELVLERLSNASVSYNSSNSTMVVVGFRPLAQQTTTQIFRVSNPSSTEFRAQDDGNGGTLITVCFLTGTLIRTGAGEVAVEDLRVGDLVVTASGEMRPIRWIGHRTVKPHRHSDPTRFMPVCISAGALGEGRPSRDLRVSPGHAVCVNALGEVLIPAIALVNGTTVRHEHVEEVTYWHVELDTHDLLIAEGQPAESYLEMDNRGFFVQADVVGLASSPDAHASARTTDDFCRPFYSAGAIVDAVRALVDARAKRLGMSARPVESLSAEPGRLIGYIDSLADGILSGWAHDLDHPGLRVSLEVLVDGVCVGSIFADQYRHDLRASDIGDACHAFRFNMPDAQRDATVGTVEVRRMADGVPLQGPLWLRRAS